MSTLILRSTDAGAPVLNGINGSLCAVLDWALPKKLWAIEFTATNARVYRASVGNRIRLGVRHDSAISGNQALALVRGCEAPVSATDWGVDVFPLVAQVANNLSNWCTSHTAGSTAAIPYTIILHEKYFVIYVGLYHHATSGESDFFFFGEMPTANAEDSWATCISVRENSGIGSHIMYSSSQTSSLLVGTGKTYWCRDITGAIKSSRGSMTVAGGQLGVCSGLYAARAGYANRIEREKIALSCTGSTTTSAGPTNLLRRAWLPNVWNGVHGSAGVLVTGDTFVDSAYNVAAKFEVHRHYSTPWSILEITDTWVKPNG